MAKTTWGLCLLALGKLALSQTPPPEDAPTFTFGTTVVIPSGLEGRIYHIPENTDRLPNFRKMKPVGTIYTTSLNLPPQDFRQGFPGVTKRFEWFAIDYNGRFWAEKPGYYDFLLLSDDGALLYIDQEMVIDNDGIHGAREATGSVLLKKGVHTIRVSYFQGPGVSIALVLKVKPPREEMRIFSTDDLKPPPSQ
jgi:hypothetical protein